MQVVIRNYTGKGAAELFDVLAKSTAELDATMRAIDGLVSYTLARSSGGGFSVTVGRDNAAIDKSTQTARDWIAKNAAKAGAAPPQVSLGEVILQVQT